MVASTTPMTYGVPVALPPVEALALPLTAAEALAAAAGLTDDALAEAETLAGALEAGATEALAAALEAGGGAEELGEAVLAPPPQAASKRTIALAEEASLRLWVPKEIMRKSSPC